MGYNMCVVYIVDTILYLIVSRYVYDEKWLDENVF